jgi:hypothetical protein
MGQLNLSPEEVEWLKEVANPGLMEPALPDDLKVKFAILGYGEQKPGRFAITEKGRRALWDLAGRRGR